MCPIRLLVEFSTRNLWRSRCFASARLPDQVFAREGCDDRATLALDVLAAAFLAIDQNEGKASIYYAKVKLPWVK